MSLFGERACRECGCTDEHACLGGCAWAEFDLCTACVTIGEEADTPPLNADGQPLIGEEADRG